MRRTAWGALLGASLLACGGARKPDPAQKPLTETVYELDLTAPLPELGTAFLGDRRPGLNDALTRVRMLREDPLTRGLFVRLGELAGHGADLTDWAGVFDEFRAQKKPVHCHFDETDNLGYALASHCDVVSMTPAGMLSLVGLAAQVMQGRELLAHLGVQADLVQVGKYKGAAEPFMRDTMSDELRANLSALLDDLEAAFHEHLAVRGKRDRAATQALINRGPFVAEDALAAGLVDAVAFDDEARARAKAAGSARSVVRLFPRKEHTPLSLHDVLDALTAEQPKTEQRPALAVAFLVGDIVDGEQGSPSQSASGAFVNEMRKLGDDRDVRAVVLRIESPGGSALASDLMWHAVHRVAQRKPVIVSLGDVAASGGYYVASAGSHIVASPSSVVGSIGVVGGKIVAGELAARVGLHADTLRRGTRAAWLSPLTPFSADERTALERMLTRTYDRFIERVALGRKRDVASFVAGTEGRVMGGVRAKALGLVDDVGGLQAAIDLARKQGKLPKDAPIRTWPDNDDPMRALSTWLGVHALGPNVSAALNAAASEVDPAVRGSFAAALSGTGSGTVLALPYVLRIR